MYLLRASVRCRPPLVNVSAGRILVPVDGFAPRAARRSWAGSFLTCSGVFFEHESLALHSLPGRWHSEWSERFQTPQPGREAGRSRFLTVCGMAGRLGRRVGSGSFCRWLGCTAGGPMGFGGSWRVVRAADLPPDPGPGAGRPVAKQGEGEHQPRPNTSAHAAGTPAKRWHAHADSPPEGTEQGETDDAERPRHQDESTPEGTDHRTTGDSERPSHQRESTPETAGDKARDEGNRGENRQRQPPHYKGRTKATVRCLLFEAGPACAAGHRWSTGPLG